jgi:DnaK suppressor protein
MAIQTKSQATTNGLTAAQLADLRSQLENERSTIAARIVDRRKGLTTATTSRPDDADWASDSVTQALFARLMDRDTKLLREVEWALGKFAAGTYGACESSGEPIDFERLRARPWSRLSLGAKERREREDAEHDAGGDSPIIDRDVA